MQTNDIIEIIEILKKTYPNANCSLDFTSPFELLIAVILSAQCTDARVNQVTPHIFAKYNTPQDFANLDINIIEDLIHSCGFYKNKAKNIKATAQRLIDFFDSQVPSNMQDLMTLPGVGRKTANVVMLEAFNSPCGIAIDTHAKRISNRLALSTNAQPEKIEEDLLKIIPHEYLKDINHLFVLHGRNICTSQNPKCDACPIRTYCRSCKS